MFNLHRHIKPMAIAFAMALLLVWSSTGFCGQYSHTYTFDAPVLQDTGNGTVYPYLKDCWAKTHPVGAPVLPRMTGKLYIPMGEELVSLSVDCAAPVALSGAYSVIPATKAAPASMAYPAKPAAKDPAIYESDADYPGITHAALGTQILKGSELAIFHLCPVQYNPVTEKISYYPAMTVTLTTRTVKSKPSPMFRDTLSDRASILRAIDNDRDFIKAVPKAKAAADAGDRQYLIITTEYLKSAMLKLAAHRSSPAGGSYKTCVALLSDIKAEQTGDDTAEKMRNYIRDSYQNHGTQFVVLGGDAHGAPGSQTMPTRGCYAAVNESSLNPIRDYNIPADLYFGCLDGPWDNNGNGIWGEKTDGTGGNDIDWTSEVYVGRISADTPDRALAQIDKIIAYETSSKPYKTLLVGEILNNEPTYGGDKMDWLSQFLPTGMRYGTLYDRDQPNHDWPAYMLTDDLSSDNYVWINHLGHSNNEINMKLNEDDISQINNSKYYFIYTQGCYAGAFDNRETQGYYLYEDCIIENMVMAGARGPFAAVANSRYGWFSFGQVYDTTSNLLNSYFIKQAALERTIGEANQSPKPDLDLTEGVYRWVAFETNLFGDPASKLPTQNTGYEGWWYMADEPGSGLSMETRGDKIYLAWYVYDDAGLPVWYSALTEKDGEHYRGDLMKYTGWPLGTPYKAPTSEKAGTVDLFFADQNEMTFSYNLDGETTWTEFYERFMPAEHPGAPDPRDITGWWVDENYIGMGWYVEAYGGSIYIGWYNYRDDSSPRWWSMGNEAGSFPATATSYTGQVLEWTGGNAPAAQYKTPVSASMGQGTFAFDQGTDTATFTFGGVTYNLVHHTF